MADNTYQIEYSKTDRASCKDAKCKQKIGKGVLRIGKEAPSPFGDDTMLNWYHASCAFRALTRAKSGTKKIDCMDDLVGHDDISSSDRKYVQRMIDGEELWTASGWKPGGAGKAPAKTAAPAKRKASTKKAPPAKKTKSGEKTYLEFYGSKFWEIYVEDDTTNIRFGKVGYAGASQTKSWGTHAKAMSEMDKMIRQKKRKGYSEKGDAEPDSDESEESESEESEESEEEESEEEEDDDEPSDWQWQDEHHKWYSYSSEQQKGIQKALAGGRLFYKFDFGSNSYRVHLKLLYQVNTETGVKRKVRIV